nr:amidohydrolase family protein [Streptomyces griseorubiginosus]
MSRQSNAALTPFAVADSPVTDLAAAGPPGARLPRPIAHPHPGEPDETAAWGPPGLERPAVLIFKPPIASGEREPWARRIRESAAEPSVFRKLSGTVTEADRDSRTTSDLRPYADVVLGAFGPSRVMSGSDWPVCPPAAFYQELVRTTEELTSGLNAVERAEVFGGTAARAYRLPLDRPREEAQ